MADGSDDPRDLVRYHRLLEDGYDCAFGSRFMPGAAVTTTRGFKLVINRVVNFGIRVLFRHGYNDTTNAFKAYRREVIETVQPLLSNHFNLTVELPLKAIVRGHSYAVVPISWTQPRGGRVEARPAEMGSRTLPLPLRLPPRGPQPGRLPPAQGLRAARDEHGLAPVERHDDRPPARVRGQRIIRSGVWVAMARATVRPPGGGRRPTSTRRTSPPAPAGSPPGPGSSRRPARRAGALVAPEPVQQPRADAERQEGAVRVRRDSTRTGRPSGSAACTRARRLASPRRARRAAGPEGRQTTATAAIAASPGRALARGHRRGRLRRSAVRVTADHPSASQANIPTGEAQRRLWSASARSRRASNG